MRVIVILTTGLLAMACGKTETTSAATTAAADPAAKTGHAALVLAYDAVREGLAIDDLKVAQAAAKALAEAHKAVAPVAAAANKLAAMATIEDARMAFGDLSKALLEAMKADAKLADNVIAYRCPMAEGYQKWVQLGAPMRNPYMGQKMLECGSKADLTP